MSKMMVNVVLTGGTRAGKTPIYEYLMRSFLTHLEGVPETAADEIEQMRREGLDPCADPELRQRRIASHELKEELAGDERARKRRVCVKLHDRGILDCAAFLPCGIPQLLSLIPSVTEAELYRRYHRVIMIGLPPPHVFDALRLSREQVGKLNETYEDALDQERRLIEIWSKHPQFTLVTAQTWEKKVAYVYELVRGIIEEAYAAHGNTIVATA